jgi:hypothetical protein
MKTPRYRTEGAFEVAGETSYVSIFRSNCGHVLNFTPGVMGFKPVKPEASEIPPEKEEK